MIDNELQAVTERGRRLVSMAERFAPEFGSKAQAHHREVSLVRTSRTSTLGRLPWGCGPGGCR
jgi:hypothetical protein